MDGQVTVLQAAALPDDRRTAQSLIPALQELLARCEWEVEDIELVCVTDGPGSFTGLRLGVTTAKTLAYASGAKLVSVPTLAVFAASVTAKYERLWAVIDAQRQELFAACFTDDVQVNDLVDPQVAIVRIDNWLSELAAGDVVVGPSLLKVADRLPESVVFVNLDNVSLATTVGELGYLAFQTGYDVDVMQLVPKYYRKSAAEEKADAKSDP